MVSDEVLRAQLERTLDETHFADLGSRYVGKVRDNYSKGGVRTIVVTDRLSAFDVVLGTIPFKGQVLNQLAAHWFRLSAKLAPNHFLAAPDPNVTRAVECEPLPLEMVVRSYLTGVTSTSIWTHYQNGQREFGGQRLPDGLTKNAALPEPLVTPSTKAEKGGHDETVTREELIRRELVDEKTFADLQEKSLALFALGQREALERGLILVDTKYEFGRAPGGGLFFIDEIHTPDSSRYWYADDLRHRIERAEEPRNLDKEYVRRELAAQGYRGDGPPPPLSDALRIEAAKRYIEAYERVTGEAFVPDLDPPLQRIRHNLGLKS